MSLLDKFNFAVDTKDSTKIDGVSHLKDMAKAVIPIMGIFLFYPSVGIKPVSQVLIVLGIQLLIVFLIFFFMEMYQEYKMKKKGKPNRHPWNPFKWSKNRHQDWGFPTVGCFVIEFLGFGAWYYFIFL